MVNKPNDNLIQLNVQYNVDLISNLSLSKKASFIKYSLVYKDFNPYDATDAVNRKNIYRTNEIVPKFKCQNYYINDQQFIILILLKSQIVLFFILTIIHTNIFWK